MSCAPGSAQVGVRDGFLMVICGCVEPAGAVIPAPASLTCTVPKNTTVFFQYIGNVLRHQIIPTGALTFDPSPLSDPTGQIVLISSHPVQFDTSGTYLFIDAIDNSLSGQIIVQ